jgi:hypothetical protein
MQYIYIYIYNIICCVERQSDECRNKIANKHEEHRGSGSQPQVAMGRPCCIDGPAKLATRCINVGRKSRQRENWETEDPMADTFQRVAGGHGSQTAKTRSEWRR